MRQWQTSKDSSYDINKAKKETIINTIMMSSEDKRGIDSKPALGKVPLDLPFTKVAVALKGGAMDFP